jgi:hypothetical protein
MKVSVEFHFPAALNLGENFLMLNGRELLVGI